MLKIRNFSAALALVILLACFLPIWAAEPEAVPTLPPLNVDLEKVRQDLQKLDVKVQYGVTPVTTEKDLPGTNGETIKSQQLYQAYRKQIAGITKSLVDMKDKLDNRNTDPSFNLQQLGAMSHGLATRNKQVRHGFKHGEEDLQSYQLIDQAVRALDEAVTYWRSVYHYRQQYRGNAWEQTDDDDVVRIKLETALTAIDSLKQLQDTQAILKKMETDQTP